MSNGCDLVKQGYPHALGEKWSCCNRHLHHRQVRVMAFPIQKLMDEQKCYDYLLQILHPIGLKCPAGHLVPPGQKPHDRHRAPVFDYRCRECGAVFNAFTDTVWHGSRYTCIQMVLILRGIAQGVPTEHLADELRVDRANLLDKRHEIQKLLEQRLSPLGADR